MQVLGFERVPANALVAKALGISTGDTVLRIKRRHFWEASPVAIAVIYLPEPLGQHITPSQVTTTPIYTLLTDEAHVDICRATQVVRALNADAETALLLAVPTGAPLMMVERVTYSTTGMPLEFIQFYHRGDSYELSIELHRDPAKNSYRPVNPLLKRIAGS